MSTQVTTAFVEQYKNNVSMLLQQKGSLLRNAVTVDSAVVGKNKFTEQIGATSAVERTTRHGDSPLMDTPHARRRLSLTDYEWGDLVDDADKVRMLIDPTSTYAQSAAYAMGRAMDDVILKEMNGTAYTGVAGGTSTGLGSGQLVAHASKGLTLDKLRQTNKLFQEAEVDPDEERFLCITPDQLEDLLNADEVISADYNTVRALVNGEVNSFMGFTFIISNRVNQDLNFPGPSDAAAGDNIDHCLAWVRSGVELGIGADIKARISERPDKAYSTYVYYSMSIGCTRLEEGKVVQIDCDRDLGI